MKKIEFYFLNYLPSANGRVIFRLFGESQNRIIDLNPTDFIAVAAVLNQKEISFDTKSGTFVSFDNDQFNKSDNPQT